jgi:hypothetical protein
MNHASFCPWCNEQRLCTPIDCVYKCRQCYKQFICLDLSDVVNTLRTPAELFAQGVKDAWQKTMGAPVPDAVKGDPS